MDHLFSSFKLFLALWRLRLSHSAAKRAEASPGYIRTSSQHELEGHQKNWRKRHLLQLSHEKPVQFTETWQQRWILSTKGTSLSHTEPAFPCFSQLMLVYHCSPEMLAASFISWVWSPSSVLASGSQTPAGTGTVPEELDGASSHILMRFKGPAWPPLTGCQCRWCILKVYQTQCALSTVGACQTWCFIICIFS